MVAGLDSPESRVQIRDRSIETAAWRIETMAPEQKKRRLEQIALLFAGTVVVASIWHWHLQVQSVLEILEMAYG